MKANDFLTFATNQADMIEGYDGSENGLYLREVVAVDVENPKDSETDKKSENFGWIYHQRVGKYENRLKNCYEIPGGDWLRRKEQKEWYSYFQNLVGLFG